MVFKGERVMVLSKKEFCAVVVVIRLVMMDAA